MLCALLAFSMSFSHAGMLMPEAPALVALAQSRGGTGDQQANAAPAQKSDNNSKPASSRAHNEPDEPPEIRVFPLQNTEPQSTSQQINVAFRANLVTPEERMNALVYHGPTALVDRVQAMINMLDVPATRTNEHEDKCAVIPVKYRRPDEIAQQLDMSLAHGSVRFAADRGSSSIIVAGKSEDIAAAQAAIAQLDRETPPVQLEFAFFGTRNPSAANQGEVSLGPVPADMQKVAEELKRFGEPGFYGRLVAIGQQDQKFSIEGAAGPQATLSIDGMVVACPANGAVKLELNAFLQFIDPHGKPGPTFKLRTSLSAERGGYMVLGSAPAGWTAGESVVLVLHVPDSSPSARE